MWAVTPLSRGTIVVSCASRQQSCLFGPLRMRLESCAFNAQPHKHLELGTGHCFGGHAQRHRHADRARAGPRAWASHLLLLSLQACDSRTTHETQYTVSDSCPDGVVADVAFYPQSHQVGLPPHMLASRGQACSVACAHGTVRARHWECNG
jgi:hypothetical protein